VLAFSYGASAQTWVAPRTTPSLVEVAAIDATGEENWPYGAEDVAGDGLDTFQQQEQSIDVRTTYVVATDTELFARAYVSDTAVPGGNVGLYVFIDADRDPTTGGSAVATDIDPRFDEDPTNGGYEYVVGVGGNEAVVGVWQWDEGSMSYEPVNDANVVAESGVDFDPIWIFEEDHGYIQFKVDLADVGLDDQCNADFFVRSLNDNMNLGDGDLNVGAKGRCVTVDDGGGSVPPVVVPPDGCTEDAQCAGNGLCIDGECVIPDGCRADADCADDERCDDRGFCVFDQSDTTCDADADCGDLVCDTASSACVACTDDAACGADRRCASTGRCVDAGDATGTGGSGTGGSASSGGTGTGTGDPNEFTDDEKVQGGAFTCAFSGGETRSLLWAMFGLLGAGVVVARRVLRGKVTG
jgi:hypothetical protein